MNKQTEALKMAMYELEIVGLKDGDTYNACKEALAEAEKQEWHSLSEFEINEFYDEAWMKYKSNTMTVKLYYEFARAIEQALKEKND